MNLKMANRNIVLSFYKAAVWCLFSGQLWWVVLWWVWEPHLHVFTASGSFIALVECCTSAPPFLRPAIRRLTSGYLSAAADSKTSPMNPVTCIVLRLLQALAGY